MMDFFEIITIEMNINILVIPVCVQTTEINHAIMHNFSKYKTDSTEKPNQMLSVDAI